MAFIFGCQYDTARLHARRVVGKNYVAYPFFSPRGFEQIEPGMTGAQVRDLIGFPKRRVRWSSNEEEVIWEYTAALFEGARRYTTRDSLTTAWVSHCGPRLVIPETERAIRNPEHSDQVRGLVIQSPFLDPG